MKKILMMILACAAVLAAGDVQAQSLQSLLKGLGNMFGKTQAAEEEPAEPEALTAEQLQGRWVYRSLDMQYTGNSNIASIAVASAKTQLSTVAGKAGLVAGRDYVDVKDDGTLSLVSGEHSTSARYDYRQQDGTMCVTMEYNGKTLSLTATVTPVGEELQVMFDAAKLVALVEKNTDKMKDNTAFQMLKVLTGNYPGIMVGAVLGR